MMMVCRALKLLLKSWLTLTLVSTLGLKVTSDIIVADFNHAEYSLSYLVSKELKVTAEIMADFKSGEYRAQKLLQKSWLIFNLVRSSKVTAEIKAVLKSGEYSAQSCC
jgi:hypothetical protein